MAEIFGNTTTTPIKPDLFRNKVDTSLSPDSTNPVQNKVLYDLFTVKNQASKRGAYSSRTLNISNALPYSPLKISIEQTVFPKEPVTENKFDTPTITSDYLIDPGKIYVDVKTGESAIFSFDMTLGEVDTFMFYSSELLAESDGMGSPIVADGIEIKTTDTGRRYVEINNTYEYDIDAIIPNCDYYTESIVLDYCALRYDGSTEYVKYEELEKIYDPSIVSVIEKTTGKSIKADADGNVDGFVFSADGSAMQFYLSGLESYFTLTINYRRSMAQEVAELKAVLASGIDLVNDELATLTDAE